MKLCTQSIYRMIGLKINRHTMRQAFNKTKNVIGQAYNHTKGMLSDLDSGVSLDLQSNHTIYTL